MTHDRETRLRMKIDSLRDECERLEARVTRLEKLVRKWTVRTAAQRARAELWKSRCGVRSKHTATCECGGPKTLQARTCHACYVAKRRSPEWREMARQWRTAAWEEAT